jgi:putative tryptophan/tyrosine transport system substrate-binding protein
MRRRDFIALAGGAAAWPLAVRAQQPGRIPRIGILWPNPLAASGHLVAAFRQGLSDLGYVEGQNMAIDFRSSEGIVERLPELAAELVRLPVDVILTATSPTIRAAQHATQAIPIVMGNSQDPVSEGFVASLARPGGNITGLTLFSPDLASKRLQLLKEVVPGLSRVAILWNADDPALGLSFRETTGAVNVLRLEVRSIGVRTPKDFDSAFDTAKGDGATALIVLEDILTFRYRVEIAKRANSIKLPAIYGLREYAEAGGLMAYGPNLSQMYRRCADYVDKILKGAKPADLPVEQPTKFELILNRKTATLIDVRLPTSIEVSADEVIE